ncbi:Uncharacterized protein TCM_009817 [Theobroma cacao]|uniref:Reverse transcriptase domain-containing protein n=1 Tax=Theobroma cacao TaxID=3641 RepID=A0A061E766_THECC|nr:Uncharacterized protein TCM_009817 [Theobroma cacao]
MQGLIKVGILNFEKKPEQNINNNPLPNHAGAGVNAIEGELYVKRNIWEVETPMQKVFEALVKADMLEVWLECPDVNDSRDIQGPYYLYHKGCVGHLIQDCSSFRKEVQRMMDESRIEFYVEVSRSAINMMAKDSTHPTKIKPLTIFYELRGESVEDKTHAKMTIEVPKPFPYKDDKAVLWNYNCNIVGKGYLAGAKLGRELQGIRRTIRVTKNEERFGLGYKPTKKEREEMIAERRREGLAHFKGHELENHGMTYPHLYISFRSGGCIFPESLTIGSRESVSTLGEAFSYLSICATEESKEQPGNVDGIPTTYLGPPKLKLSSWTTMSLLVTYDSILKIPNNECEDDNDSGFEVNFEKGTSVSEIDDTENVKDYDLTPDLLRLVEQEGRQIVPHQETLEMINLGNEENKKEVRIGTTLVPIEKEKLIKLLHEYEDVFAWSYQVMPRLNTDIVAHKLPLKPECKPIKQKLRRMKPEMLLKIKEKVKKQFDAGFLEVAKYPEWVANIVPVPKKDGKVRMCVDYRDLNRDSPKDNFPLPHINTLVDNTARHSMFSFMDGFSGYNQIKMALEDREKTTFITMWGTFCYKVMPFGLKNAGVTYQRAMVTLFHDMMHREVEVYVDDMIVKAHKTEDHATNLERLFKRLRKFQLRLNPTKCTFGVTSGKLLGFLVSERGIEVDPDKVQAICDLPPPKTSFVNTNPGAWNEECQVAFDKVKEYLLSPPVLVPPVAVRPLFLYLTVNEGSMGYVLGQHDETGRVVRWQVLLSEYDIVYVSQKAIKGSAILDFLAERVEEDYEPMEFEFPDEDLMSICQTNEEESEEKENWKMFFNGASNALGHGIGVVLVSLEGDQYPVIAKLNFYCTNNVAEYEACAMGLQAVIERKIHILEVYGDYALVIYQLRGEWETCDSKLVRYHKYVSKLIKNFNKIRFTHLPREDNQMADALTTLAAMFKVGADVKIQPVMINLRECPTHCSSVEGEVDGKPWYHDILHYLKFQ